MIKDLKDMKVKFEVLRDMVECKDPRISQSIIIKADMSAKRLYESIKMIDSTLGVVDMGSTGFLTKSTVKNAHKLGTQTLDKISEHLDIDALVGAVAEDVPVEGQIINNNVIRCPKCGSTDVYTGKKGFGIGKAVVGTAVTGLVGGVLLGSMGRKKLEHTCINCNHRFKNK